MSLHRACFDPVPTKTSRHVIVAEALRIEPILERRDRAVVLERSAVPDATQRSHDLVRAEPDALGEASSLERWHSLSRTALIKYHAVTGPQRVSSTVSEAEQAAWGSAMTGWCFASARRDV